MPRLSSRRPQQTRTKKSDGGIFLSNILCVALFLLASLRDVDISTFRRTLSHEKRELQAEEDNNKPPPLFNATKCSARQLQTLRDRFYPPQMKQPQHELGFWRRFKTPLMLQTKCPEQPWLEQYFATTTQRRKESSSSSYLGINVGCNKGLDAVAMARMLSRDSRLDIGSWQQALGSVSEAVCGVPVSVEIPPNATAAASSGTIHCIEPMPATVTSLQNALRTTGYTDAIVIKHAVISNTSGIMADFPNATSGTENLALSNCQDGKYNEEIDCIKVPMYSLNEYMKEVEIGDGAQSTTDDNQPPIDMMLIDTEGFDWEVLQGAQETLRRTRYLTFEVHMNGNWPVHSLVDAIETTLSDFVCYWTGRNQLHRITNCMNEELKAIYEYKSWSNIACAHKTEIELAQIMENLFQRNTPE